MEELGTYLISHMILDFDGDIDSDHITRLLAELNTPLAQDLKARFAAEGGPDEFLLVMCDCLREYIKTGVSPEKVEKQIGIYVES